MSNSFDIAPGLTFHTIVLCVDKRERGLVLETLLNKKGYHVVTVSSVYEALRSVQQEMPHLVICDSILSDGTAGTVYDRLQQQPTLSRTPIMVLIPKKTKEFLTPLTGRKFAGFLLGQFDGPTLLGKIGEVMKANNHISPYFVPFIHSDTNPDLNISVDATVLGLSGEQVIYKSATEIDGAAALVCVPHDKSYPPVLLKMGSNVLKGEEVFNLFPVSRIRGKGRKWVATLPNVDIDAEEEKKIWRVVFFDPNQQRADQFKDVLSGYNIDLVHANSVQKAAQLIQRDADSLGCAYFHELSGPNTAVVKEVLHKLGGNTRVAVIVGTSSLNVKSTNDMRFIKRPFGLGQLVDMMESAFKSTGDSADKLAKAQDTANLECSYHAPAKLVGLDETGGILQLKFPVVKGNRVKLDHELLKKVWDGDNLVEITHASSVKDKPDVWQARFTVVSASGTNKAKYWEKVQKILQEEYPSLFGVKESA